MPQNPTTPSEDDFWLDPGVDAPPAPPLPQTDVEPAHERRRRTAPRAQSAQIARASDTGESAQDIIAAWHDWMSEGWGTIPQRDVARLAKEVKELITSGFTARVIREGLLLWSAELMNNMDLSPTRLTRFTWMVSRGHHRSGNPQRIAELKQAAAQITAAAYANGYRPPNQRGGLAPSDQRIANARAAAADYIQGDPP